MLGATAETWALVGARLGDARSGRGGAVALCGEPGSGKSTLLARAAAAVRDAGGAVVSLHADVAEASMASALLHDLVGALDTSLASLPTEAVAALEAAVGRRDGEPSPLAVATATLALLRAAANGDAPLLLTVDDAHHLDAASRDALAFCAKRLDDVPVLLLGAWCSSLDGPPPVPGTFEAVALVGLDDAATAELLRGASGEPPGPGVAAALRRETGGNPLATAELAARCTEAQREGRERVPDAGQASGAVARFAAQLAELDPAVRAVLNVAVVGDGAREVEARRALATLGVHDATFDHAFGVGLVTVGGDGVHVAHPVLRAAVAQGIPPARARELHDALAIAADDPARVLWHRANAVTDVDDALADELAASAGRDDARGAHDLAARAWERAAELTTGAAIASQRWFGAGTSRHLSGDFDRAEELLVRALDGASPTLRAEIQHRRGHMLMWRGRTRAAIALLGPEARELERTDPLRATIMLMQALVGSLQAGDLDASLEGARLCHEMGSRFGGPLATGTGAMFGFSRLLTGDADGELLVLAAADIFDELEPWLEPLPMSLALTSFVGQMLTVVEAHDEADVVLTRTIDAARSLSASTLLAIPLAHHSNLALRRGDMELAASRAHECLAVASELGEMAHRAIGLGALGAVDAVRGDHAGATEHLDEATALARSQGLTSVFIQSETSRGLLALGAGEPDAALAAHERLARRNERDDLRHPGLSMWAGDHVEALVRTGDPAGAAVVLDRFEAAASMMRGYVPRAVAERCRGLLAGSGADEHFERAMKMHDRVHAPFERARTELCFGERLRRDGKRTEARRMLRRARSTFEMLGARDWAARAAEELRASGARGAEPSGGGAGAAAGTRPASLTSQEARIVTLVASGRTNREVASELFLSPKTVENHLGRIYAKLGVRRRTDLARLAVTWDD